MFAARYQMYAMRRVKLQDEENLLKRETWYHYPARAEALFGDKKKEGLNPEPLTVGGRGIEEVVNDLDVMDAYFANLDNDRHVSGGTVHGIFGANVGEWV